MRYVYVAGPLTHGDHDLNIKNALEAASKLFAVGFMPYCPHLSAFWHEQFPMEYEEWMRLDAAWLERCDALVRLPGFSPGADREVEYATKLGIPVYLSLDDLLKVSTL